jgi:predicted RNA-binding protein with PUA domain
MKIVICGSMTLAQKMLEAERELQSRGHQIILPEFVREYAVLENAEDRHSESAKNKVKYGLIRQYFEKIRESDAVLVLNEERHGIPDYIGGNSFLEMGFAHVLVKEIYLLNPIPKMSYTDEIRAMRPIVINRDYNLIK